MKAEQIISISIVMLLGLSTLFGGSVAPGLPSLLSIRSTLAANVVGSGDCVCINQIDDNVDCPKIKNPDCCMTKHSDCVAAKTNQTNTSQRVKFQPNEVCQDIDGCCGEEYNWIFQQGGCDRNIVKD